MSRLFDGTTDNLDVDVAPVTAVPLTLACWFRHDNITDNDALVWLGDKDVADQYFVLEVRGGAAGDKVRARAAAAGPGIADTTTGFSATTWHHACGVFTANNDRAALIDGGSKGTNTQERVPLNADRVSVGRLGDSTPSNFMSGRIAEVGIWNVALSDDEVGSLAGGTSPLMVRPGSLVGYWPLWGVDSPEPDYAGSNNLIVTNAVLADHSPTALMLPPTTGWQGAFTTAAVAGGSLLQLPHHMRAGFNRLHGGFSE